MQLASLQLAEIFDFDEAMHESAVSLHLSDPLLKTRSLLS